jgi:hypothetical protein
MGEAFRAALGIASSPAWRAQGEFAQAAQLGAPDNREKKLATLRQIVSAGYRTQPLVGRRPPAR